MKKVILKINGGNYCNATMLNKEQFIDKFTEAGELMLSDNELFWVIEENVDDHYLLWCIEKEEVDFIQLNGQWCIFEDFLEEEPDSYTESLEKYLHFEDNFAQYILHNKRADAEDFMIWQKLQAFIESEDSDVKCDNMVILIEYLTEQWNAWLESILDETYKYMNFTSIVWKAWEEAIQLKNALEEVLRDYHAQNDQYAVIIKNNILVWYYTTYITAEECIELLVEYLTKGQLTLSGKFNKKF